MTELKDRLKEVLSSDYSPVVLIFVVKSLILGMLMSCFGFKLHPDVIEPFFTSLQSFNFQPWLGVGFLCFAALGAWGLFKENYSALLTFCLTGIIFASIVGTTLLIGSGYAINGVSYIVDTLVLIWVFLQLSLKNRFLKLLSLQ